MRISNKINQLFGIIVVIIVFLFVTNSSRADWLEQQKLTASDAFRYDYFAFSVSIDGDYALIGSCYDDGNEPNSGTAYVFKRTGGSWSEEDEFFASDGVAFDSFGSSVSISGDYAIVGAYAHNSYTGAAYIFKRSGSSWNQVAKLTASDGASGDYFGCSVSISGDYVIVGAYFDTDMGVNQCGSAYIFEKPVTGWVDMTETIKLLAYDPGPTNNERFGYSVAIDANCAIVGAPWSTHSALTQAGAVYKFKRLGLYWVPEPLKLTASDASAGDLFGISVAIDANYAIVGATDDDIDDVNGQTGCAYIFENNGSPVWIEQNILFPSDPCMTDLYYFGRSVSISGDYALVGSAPAFIVGSGYVYRRSGTSWPELKRLTAAGLIAADSFGYSVSIDDGYAIIGAWYDDIHGTAYTFEQVCPPTELTGDCCVDNKDLDKFTQFWLFTGCGAMIDCAGTDLNGDGTVNFIDHARLANDWLKYN